MRKGGSDKKKDRKVYAEGSTQFHLTTQGMMWITTSNSCQGKIKATCEAVSLKQLRRQTKIVS